MAVLILLLGAGAAAAIVLTGGEDETEPSATAASEKSPIDSSDEETTEAEPPETESDGYPPVARQDMETAIESALLTYHENVVTRDFRSAWALLSSRKRQQNVAEYGYGEWRRAQESLTEDLDPYGLTARIDALEGEGVARVMVTGMGWSAPSSSCSEWSGLTWAKYEGGEWTYDPGYSTTSARRRVWEPRADELLGANC
ncbi:MAG TPA: hypothetical protein VI039_08625 [Solirubrobacterales bacterium]